MTPNLDGAHLRRYKDIAKLLVKHGRGDLVEQARQDPIFAAETRDESTTEQQAAAEELTEDLENLGPTFIKLGQLLSSRSDLFPPVYLEALARLQDDVEPISFDEVEEVVTQELGVRLSKAFSFFDTTPLASASLGQVHRAELRDGRPVAVKVQRPGVRQRVAEDLEVLSELAKLADQHTDVGRRMHFAEVVAEFRKTLAGELDYRREATHLRTLSANLESYSRLLVPAPVEDYTTSRVLTMEYVAGTRLDALSPVVQLGIDGAEIADQLFEAYLDQILVDGLFHADPHLGNVLLTRDHRLALLDLGMVGHVSPGMQEDLLHILLALSEGKGQEVARRALALSVVTEDAGVERFSHEVADLVARKHRASLQELEVGRVVLQVARLGAGLGVRVPPTLTMLGKALLNLDEVGRALDPSFDPNDAIRRHAGKVMSHSMGSAFSLSSMFSSMLEAKELMESLPGRLNQILERLANNEMLVRVDAIDEEILIVGLQKIANRITVGLILAALIVGAALMMRVETSFTILGYPGFAMLLFLAAAIGGGVLVWDILMKDRRRRRRR